MVAVSDISIIRCRIFPPPAEGLAVVESSLHGCCNIRHHNHILIRSPAIFFTRNASAYCKIFGILLSFLNLGADKVM